MKNQKLIKMDWRTWENSIEITVHELYKVHRIGVDIEREAKSISRTWTDIYFNFRLLVQLTTISKKMVRWCINIWICVRNLKEIKWRGKNCDSYFYRWIRKRLLKIVNYNGWVDETIPSYMLIPQGMKLYLSFIYMVQNIQLSVKEIDKSANWVCAICDEQKYSNSINGRISMTCKVNWIFYILLYIH